jgi:hypothetical protein
MSIADAKVGRETHGICSAKPVCEYFGDCKLRKITGDAIKEYRTRRTPKDRVSNVKYNRELDNIRGVLKGAKLWQRVAEDIEPLPPNKKRPCAGTR